MAQQAKTGITVVLTVSHHSGHVGDLKKRGFLDDI